MKILVVVDMQEDFVSGSLGSVEARRAVPKVINKIKEYVDRNDAVLFTFDTHDENYLDTREGMYLPVPHCIAGTDGWALPPEFFNVVCPGYVLEKSTFGSPALPEAIRTIADDRGVDVDDIDSIEFVGLCTDICVVSNVLIAKAHFSEIPIVVDSSCCAGITPSKHEAALEVMRSCQIEVV